MNSKIWDLIVVGAGPNGLAVGLHARQRGLDALVLERGHIAENIANFPKQMVFFGDAVEQEIAGLPFDCPRARPTREEFLSYLVRVVSFAKINVSERTIFTGLEGSDGDFVVRAMQGREPVGLRTKKLVVAAGVFGQPNRLDVPGADLAKVAYAYGDPYRFRRQHVLIVGAGSGAAEAALRLYREGDARVTVLNQDSRVNPRKWRWQLPDMVELVENGLIRLVHDATLERIEDTHVVFSSPAGRERIANDHVIVQIGYRPDTTMFDAVGITYNESATPHLDPCTLETNRKGVYVAGAAVTGAADYILISGGRNHGKAIVAHILGEEPLVKDLGASNPDHWIQFEKIDDSLDQRMALDLVPLLVGDFPHQLLDVYQGEFLKYTTQMKAQGVPLEDWRQQPFQPGRVIDVLSDMHLERHDDGSVRFKGEDFPGDALEILRLADGTRRIRDIIAEIEVIYSSKKRRLPAQTVVNFLIDLLRVGKLTWRVEPLPATASPAKGAAQGGQPA